jgi:hypothetical protein
VAHVVAVEHVSEFAALHELGLDRDRDRRLARTREPREPNRGAALSEERFAFLASDLPCVPGDVGGSRVGHGRPLFAHSRALFLVSFAVGSEDFAELLRASLAALRPASRRFVVEAARDACVVALFSELGFEGRAS